MERNLVKKFGNNKLIRLTVLERMSSYFNVNYLINTKNTKPIFSTSNIPSQENNQCCTYMYV